MTELRIDVDGSATMRGEPLPYVARLDTPVIFRGPDGLQLGGFVNPELFDPTAPTVPGPRGAFYRRAFGRSPDRGSPRRASFCTAPLHPPRSRGIAPTLPELRPNAPKVATDGWSERHPQPSSLRQGNRPPSFSHRRQTSPSSLRSDTDAPTHAGAPLAARVRW